MEQIKHERVVELSGEVVRFFDLKRWGMYNSENVVRDPNFESFVEDEVGSTHSTIRVGFESKFNSKPRLLIHFIFNNMSKNILVSLAIIFCFSFSAFSQNEPVLAPVGQ